MTIMISTILPRQSHPKNYRDRQEIMRHILTYIEQSPYPVLFSKLEIITGTNAFTQRGYLQQLENAGLIKAYAKEWGNRQVLYYAITRRGKKALDLLDAQVDMLEGARWIKETTRAW